MSNLILLLVCLLLGIVLRRVKMMPADAHVSINTVILYVPLPAMAVLQIPHLTWEPSLICLVLVAWILFGLAYVFFIFLGKRFNWPQSVVGCLILCAGLGNTSFVGFPIIEALYGKEMIKLAILVDQPGTFFLVSSLGIWVAATFAEGKISHGDLAKKVLLFPPFVGFISALILGFVGWRASGEVQTILERLASILTPLALISVGLQLKWCDLKTEYKFLSVGLGYKLILCPIVIFALYSLMGIPAPIFTIAVMEAAMAPMITACILAATYKLEPKLAGMMVGLGVPLSFLTLSVWYLILGG